mmetsp:Transcript_4189/g.7677  ORF Transcript_4189/g.7677 Transcript_4189/m.7677 type:complete len:202 (-) Transcript_4189:144-749(-)
MAGRRGRCDWAGVVLRVFIVIGTLSGLALAGLALSMEMPPQSVPTWSLLSLGILTVMSGLIGIIATFTRGCCLVMYFGVGLVSFLMQVVVLVGLFFYYDWTVEALTNGNPDDMVSIEQYLSIGKWVLFGLVIAQLVSLVMALFVRCTAPTVEFHNLDAAEDRELHMQAIRDDIEERKVDTTDSSLAGRMSEKYGKFSRGAF